MDRRAGVRHSRAPQKPPHVQGMQQVFKSHCVPVNMSEGCVTASPVTVGFAPLPGRLCGGGPAVTVGLKLHRTLPVQRALSGCPVDTGSSVGAVAVRVRGSRSSS